MKVCVFPKVRLAAVLCAGVVVGLSAPVTAQITTTDTFGTTGNEFTIDFVHIGNAGNTGITHTPYNAVTPVTRGGVDYTYRMGVYEISLGQMQKAIDSGLSNVAPTSAQQQQTWQWRSTQPVSHLNWYEAAAFVNWLNTSTGYQEAYKLSWDGAGFSMALWTDQDAGYDANNLYRNRNAKYVLPSENEFFKAAFHKNDGVTANYWDYATGSNDIPIGMGSSRGSFEIVYDEGLNIGLPRDVDDVGLPSPYGTYGQTGNNSELLESAYDGTNNSPTENRLRTSLWASEEPYISAKARESYGVGNEAIWSGLRVAALYTPKIDLLGAVAQLTYLWDGDQGYGRDGLPPGQTPFKGTIEVSSFDLGTNDFATLQWAYTPIDLSALNISEETLRLYWFDEANDTWILAGEGSNNSPNGGQFVLGGPTNNLGDWGLDLDNNFAWANIDHASEYALAGFSLSADDDNDGLSNEQEQALGTNPLVADTDGDGRSDGTEVAEGTNPLVKDYTFGTGENAFTMDFVDIGFAGNVADTAIMNDATTGYGSVSYEYSIGTYEVTSDQWATVTGFDNLIEDSSNDPWSGSQPTANVSWYEAAKFANWLTSGNALLGAYQFSDATTFTGVDRDAALATYDVVYVLPSEDEWYKAAYLKSDGSGYTLYATGDTTPDGIDSSGDTTYDSVFYDGFSNGSPYAVGGGTVENNGTYDMGGNVEEWNESAWDGTPHGPGESGVMRGGDWDNGSWVLQSSMRSRFDLVEDGDLGFRVARLTADTDGDGIPNESDPDDDNDGLSDADEETFGTDRRKADTDGDGDNDYVEFLAGTDPLDAASRFRLVGTHNGSIYSFPMQTVAGRTYKNYVSKDLVNWYLHETQEGDGTQHVFSFDESTIPVDSPVYQTTRPSKYFFRVEITP